MIMQFRRFRGLGVALLAGGVAAACGSMPTTTSQPVQASSPSVTYNYRTDQELLRANQNATTYCAQYQTAPRTGAVTNNADGTRTVVFDCVRTAAVPMPAPAPVPINPNLSYNYRTDQELVLASQNAGAYCQRYSAQPMTSTVMGNTDGSRTVTFACAR